MQTDCVLIDFIPCSHIFLLLNVRITGRQNAQLAGDPSAGAD
jgi:hypothetical protein